MRPPPSPDLHFWRDSHLGGACLLHARYGPHHFARHLHEEMVIAVTEDGAGEVRTRSGAEVGGPGSVWVFAPGEVHGGRVEEGRHWSYRGIYLDVAALRDLADAFGDPEHAIVLPPGLHQDAQVARVLARAHAELEDGASALDRQVAWWSAMGLLLGRYGRQRLEQARASRAALARARDRMAALDEQLTVDALAREADLSRWHFIRAFQREFGLPPHAYANQLRLQAARHLLVERRSPGEAAHAVGLCDQSHLNRLFKRAYGLTPGQYAALWAPPAGAGAT